MDRRWLVLPVDKRRDIMRAAGEGLTYREIVERCDVGMGSVVRVLVPLGGVIRKDTLERPSSRLSLEDRVQIRVGLERGWTYRQIAASLSRPRAASTVCREVAAGGGRSAYAPLAAHREAVARARRPKVTKLAANPELCARVAEQLQRLWSPQQIARRLRADFGEDASMHISHETIYKTLYVQGRGELRRELTRCLRSGRAIRKSRGRLERRGRLADMVMLSERPAEAEDRAVPGHWEGDLIIGKNGASAIGTLVERSSRFVLLFALPRGRSAAQVRVAMSEVIATLPEALKRSLTWDQGSEMAQHRQFSVDTGVPVFFCDPHAPWQRGSNENTNGLLRQYFPKGTDLSLVTDDQLRAAADGLNGRPRKTLEWMSPSEKLAQLVAPTG